MIGNSVPPHAKAATPEHEPLGPLERLWRAFRDRALDTWGRSVDGGMGTNTPHRGSVKIRELSELPSVWDLKQSIEWLIQDLIAAGSVTLITAESGTGKTWLAHALAGGVARGKPFAECPTQQRPVLYIDGENPLSVVKRNLAALGMPKTDALKIWGGWVGEAPPGPSDTRVVGFAESDPHGLIIYDSLVEFHPGDEQSSTETRKYMKHFRRLADAGASVIVLHHTGKAASSKQYRGSSDIKAAVDTAYHVISEEKDGKLHKLFLEPFKSRLAPGRKLALELIEGHGFRPCQSQPEAPSMDISGALCELIAAHPGSTGAEIGNLARERGLPKGKVEECLKSEALKGDGLWTRTKGDGNSFHYTIRDPEDAEDEADEEEVEVWS